MRLRRSRSSVGDAGSTNSRMSAPALIARTRVRKDDRRPEHAEPAELRMIVFAHEVVMAYRGIVCHELGERLHGRGGDVVLRQQGEPMGTRLGAEAILEDRQERACVVV